MNKRRLNELLKRYQKEVRNGDMSHLNDLIASMVISDLTEISDSYLTLYSVDEITLSKLLGQREPKEITVPSRYEINDEKLRFEALSKSRINLIGPEEKKAANTWMDMMINTDMIKEREKINPSKIVLDNFIEDFNLREILPIKHESKKEPIIKPIVKEKGIKNKPKRH